MTGAALKGRHSIWLLWLVLLISAPFAGAWMVAVSSMLASGSRPPWPWMPGVAGWFVASVLLLIWSRQQALKEAASFRLRWALHLSGLVVALVIGVAWTLVYFYSGDHHG